MATLVLGALGTLVGGPIGGAIGALAGRQIDAQIIGGGSREGPRLKELAVSTSSYGTPIPRLFGTMRVPGTVVWATDLVEHRESSGGGKGRPGTTSYSYSASFAVVLASRPLVGLGRIWADGNLLRGAAGDLKAGGMLRFHPGHGDALPDPLLAAAIGADCPALRGRAYVVFEDLQLADFGNRIPALTFEAIADPGPFALAEVVAPLGPEVEAAVALPGLAGLSDGGDGLAALLAMIDQLYPLKVCDTAAGLQISPAVTLTDGSAPLLPEPVLRGDSEDPFDATGAAAAIAPVADRRSLALRYYDTARDYQPGLQRSPGRASAAGDATIDFAAALAPDQAAALVAARAAREAEARSTLRWRAGGLDPAWAPGATVAVPGYRSTWRVTAWEWREGGVELDLARTFTAAPGPVPGASGAMPPPPDASALPTLLRAFELPLEDGASAARPPRFAALAAAGPAWRGAALYREEAGALIALGTAPRHQATLGTLATALAPSPARLFEAAAALEVSTVSPAAGFAGATLAALALGANRLLVGAEIIQFAAARQLDQQRWLVSGLLRGRGGTEAEAMAGHPAGTAVTLIDDALVTLDNLPDATTQLAAIGAGDSEPVLAPIESAGLAERPLLPVHPRAVLTADGSLALAWTRRARGAWRWLDGVEAPLNEERESYLVGIGNVAAPRAVWEVGEPRITLGLATMATFPGEVVWASQIGRFARSRALLLATL